MFEIVLSTAVFVLAVAVVGLFAMMGELAARVPDPQAAEPPDPTLTTVDDALIGAVPGHWPDGLAHLADADRGVVVVLSTLCAACDRIAKGDTGLLVIPPSAGVLISASRDSRGRAFLDEHPMLHQYPTAVDAGGDWLTTTLGIDISPAVLVFERGRLRSAQTFTAAAALRQLPSDLAIVETTATEHHHEREGVNGTKTPA